MTEQPKSPIINQIWLWTVQPQHQQDVTKNKILRQTLPGRRKFNCAKGDRPFHLKLFDREPH